MKAPSQNSFNFIRHCLAFPFLVSLLTFGNVEARPLQPTKQPDLEALARLQGALEPRFPDGKPKKPPDLYIRIAVGGYVRALAAPPGFHWRMSSGSEDPAEAAIAFVNQWATSLGWGNKDTQFLPGRVEKETGRKFVHAFQYRWGLPVFGSEVVVQVNDLGGVEFALADISHRLQNEGGPDQGRFISATTAKERATEFVQKKFGIKPTLTTPRLYYFDPEVLGAPGAPAPVWHTVASSSAGDFLESIFINALSGEVVFNYSEIRTARYREIYDAANIPGWGGLLVRSEGQGPSGVLDADLAYEYFGDAYAFYHSRFGLDAPNGQGMTLRARVRYCESLSPCPEPNAAWDPQKREFLFGDGFAVDDVTGHEFTHAVTQFASNLIYWGESGAINESLSDIFGEFIDLTNGKGNDSASVRWVIGEELPTPARRSMSDPPAFNQPDRRLSPLFANTSQDQGGVHINSGVGNKLAYLLTDGGSFNGHTVTALGLDKVAQLFYYANKFLLPRAADYFDLYEVLLQSAQNLGWSTAELENLKEACRAVEIAWDGQVTTIVNESFEGLFPPPGWQVRDHSGVGIQWGQASCLPASEGLRMVSFAGAGPFGLSPCPTWYPAGIDTSLTYGPFSLNGAAMAWMEYRIRSNFPRDGTTQFAVLYSTDGLTFAPARTFQEPIQSLWASDVVDFRTIPGAIGSTTLYIRFRFASSAGFSSSLSSVGVFLDQVVIKKVGGLGASFTVTPTIANIGQNVTLQLASVTGTFSAMRYAFEGATTCSGESQRSLMCSLGQCNAGSTQTVAFANAGTVNLKLYGTPTTGSEVLLDHKAVAVANQGSCGGTGSGTLTVTATPSSPQAGQQVRFSFIGNPPIPSSGSGSFTATFGDGSAPSTLSWPCSLLCQFFHTYTAAGTYTVTITGTVGGVNYTGTTQVVVAGGGWPLTISVSPTNPQVGQSVTFTISGPPPNGSGSITVNTGEGVKTVTYPCPMQLCIASHTYQTSGAKSITAAGTVNGVAYSGSTTVTVLPTCPAPEAPIADFTWSPAQPRAGQVVQFTDQSAGGPTSWQWDFGLPSANDVSTAQNPTFTYSSEGTFTVTLTASNCKGSSTKQKQISVLPACGEPGVPEADFAWLPVEPSFDQLCQLFPAQCSKQPYAGQKVRLTDTSTNNPTDWNWYVFQETQPDFTEQATVTVQWNEPGPKNVRLKAKNCVGWSSERLKTITVYPDERPVTADFDPPANVSTGKEVTLTAKTGFAYGDPTEFTWEIQDPKPGEPNPVKLTGNPVNYSFKCGGHREVKLTAKRGTYTGTVTKTVEVSGQICGPEAFVLADAAKVPGLNNTLWRTDIRIFNPASSETRVNLYVLEAGKSNSAPPGVSNVPIPARGSLALDNVLEFFRQQAGVDVSKAAIRVTFENADGVPPVVVGRTYTDVAGGGTFGQLIPALEVRPGSMPREQWITGLRHDGTGGEGFRTNVSLYNLRPSEARLDLYLYDAQGQLKAVKQGKSIAPLAYEQAPILSFFNLPGPLGIGAVKMVLLERSEVGFNVSVVDNKTGDASLASNEPPASGTALVIPGIAHNTGAAGSVWRSSLTVTNPGSSAANFTLKFVPKGLPKFEKDVTLPATQTLSIEDVVAWIVEPLAAPEASGTLVVYPKNGVFPVVSARTFNLVPNGGTFGQTLKVFHAGNAAGKDTSYRRLYLTGMASEDIARSNLGFVHVGGPTVNFKVWFYDEQGRLLNPDANTPYTVALSETNPWDQDKLEYRFRNKGWTLPANLRVISAVIEVEGGMGQAYASVIDNLTNDPIFIPAVPAP